MHFEKTIYFFRYFSPGRGGRWAYLLIYLVLCVFCTTSRAQISLNVKDFGAIGDAVQFYANTVSNSVIVTTTNVFSPADIGKSIEVTAVGKQTFGGNTTGGTDGNQDLIATVTNVISGTNLYLSKIPQNTLTNTFSTIGTDNSLAFSNVIQSAQSLGTSININVPNGRYLCLAKHMSLWYANVCIPIYGGGWHLIGENETNTVILGQGAWILDNTGGVGVYRGFLFAFGLPITNNSAPVSFENLTLDGGVEHGAISYKSVYPNNVDGQGWDVSHSAIDIRGGSQLSLDHWTITNCIFKRWRGEMLKSNDSSTNGNLTIANCVFEDGNATALNIYPSLLVTNCVFDNIYQVAEYYQHYSTNASWFINNLVTNVYNNAFSFNGADGKNPPFYVYSNTFFAGNGGYNQIVTTPGYNIYIISNRFLNPYINAGSAYGITIGSAGYQSPNNSCNSNIFILDNIFSNYGSVLAFGNYISNSVNRTDGLIFAGNTMSGDSGIHGNGWYDHVQIYSNTVLDKAPSSQGNRRLSFSVREYGQPLVLMQTNNYYWTPTWGMANTTNFINYAKGSRFQLIYKLQSNAVFALTDTNAATIPAGAQILIWNTTLNQDNSTGTNSVQVYLDSSATGQSVSVPDQAVTVFNWNGSAWKTNAVNSSNSATNSATLSPPTLLRIMQ